MTMIEEKVIDKKKLTVITCRPIWPITGGDSLRIYKIIEYLEQFFDVTVVYGYHSGAIDTEDFPLVGVKLVHAPISIIGCMYRGILSLLMGRSFQTNFYHSKKFKKAAQAEVDASDYVLMHLIRTVDLVDVSKKEGVVYELTDAISMNYLRISWKDSFSSLKNIVFKWEGPKLLKAEINALTRGCNSSFISQVDRQFICDHSTTKSVYSRTFIYGNGVDFEMFPYGELSEEELTDKVNLLFIGNMFSAQNQSMVKEILYSILPKIKPGLVSEVLLVGKYPQSFRQSLGEHDKVVWTGIVDDFKEISINRYIGLCPMTFGAGVQNKVLNYFALGCPVVTTKSGIEGIEATEGVHYLGANTSQDFVNAIESLLSEEEAFLKYRREAFKLVRTLYSWEGQLSGYEMMFRKRKP
ncbi:glycosyltransferase [Litoribacillus peritrichatus]|uniref:Glycosyltransferase family 4 protein n=1 Tax=Litoribacillus peritrichatus TaxID=718191 RepID=A0ABP7LZK6_9GAMM